MDWKYYLLKFDGRITRLHYFLGSLVVFVVAMMGLGLGILLATYTDVSPLIGTLAAVPFLIVALWFSLALVVKRLHDRNRSGLFYAVFFGIPKISDKVSDKLAEGSAAWWVISCIGLAVAVWGIVELFFLKGTDGENEYGPDPLQT